MRMSNTRMMNRIMSSTATTTVTMARRRTPPAIMTTPIGALATATIMTAARGINNTTTIMTAKTNKNTTNMTIMTMARDGNNTTRQMQTLWKSHCQLQQQPLNQPRQQQQLLPLLLEKQQQKQQQQQQQVLEVVEAQSKQLQLVQHQLESVQQQQQQKQLQVNSSISSIITTMPNIMIAPPPPSAAAVATAHATATFAPMRRQKRSSLGNITNTNANTNAANGSNNNARSTKFPSYFPSPRSAPVAPLTCAFSSSLWSSSSPASSFSFQTTTTTTTTAATATCASSCRYSTMTTSAASSNTGYGVTMQTKTASLTKLNNHQVQLHNNNSLKQATLLPQAVRSKSTTNDDNKGAMDDEYGAMSSEGKTFTYPTPYCIESFGMFGHYPSIAVENEGSHSNVMGGGPTGTNNSHVNSNSNATSKSTTTKNLPRGVLNPAFIKYNTYGTLNAARDNVLVICHALTGNASLEAWWGDLLGPGKAFDTDQYFIVCCNILGSCYGSCGPDSLRPGYDENNANNANEDSTIPPNIPRNKMNQPIYGIDFPDVSVRDTVRLQLLLLKNELKINSVKCVIGGSFGGMQVMEYCVMAGATRPVGGNGDTAGGGAGAGGAGAGVVGARSKNGVMGGVPYGIGEFVTKRNGRIEPFVRSAVPIACGAAHTAWQIAISETQRQAIYADPKWKNGRVDPHDPPHNGLSVARQIGMVSYRTPLGYHQKFGRALTDESMPSYGSRAPWQVKSYLEYQGKKFLDRFDPVTYVKLTEQMDSHDVGRGRGTIEQVLSHVEIPVCVLGIDSDVLYTLREQEELARWMPNAELKIIHSDAGHDGFLLEQDQVAAHIKSFLYSHE